MVCDPLPFIKDDLWADVSARSNNEYLDFLTDVYARRYAKEFGDVRIRALKKEVREHLHAFRQCLIGTADDHEIDCSKYM